MDTTATPLLDALKPELTVGPEHHRFRLSSALGPHPLGQLWTADDLSTTTPTPVTLLFISHELLKQSGVADRLRDTLNRNRNIKDPQAARCYGLFTWRGLFFSSWEALDGLTLSQMLADGRAYKMKETQKRGMILQVGRALEAHLKQFNQPHACLAPELIYLNRSNGVRLMGYQWRALLDPLLSHLPYPVGHRQWQSADAFHPNPLDSREDVFALACLIYQLHAGKPAFNADEGEESRQQKELKSPSGLSRDPWRVLQSALSYETEQRPQTPMELLRQLYTEKHEETPPKAEEAPKDSTPPAEAAGSPSTTATLPRFQIPTSWIKPAVAGTTLFFAGVLLGYWIAPGGDNASSGEGRFVSGQLARLQQENDSLNERIQQLEQPSTPTAPSGSPAQTESVETPAVPEKIADTLATTDGTELKISSGEAMRNAEKPADNLSVFQDKWGPDRFAPQMVVIPKGRFRMGDLHGAGDDNEYPVHEVIIDSTFALSRFEVTFSEYDQFATETGRTLPDDEGRGRGNQPVVNVSWQDAKAYVRWLAEQSGQPYRLPTEAEWEYVARAGTETQYWWGDELSQRMAVCDGCGTKWDGKGAAPVGSFPANPWGIHDLNGNVDEWVEDCYSGTYDGLPANGRAHTGGNCSNRVMRGGSWFEIPRLIRSASRYRHPANTSRNSWGFRVALDLPSN